MLNLNNVTLQKIDGSIMVDNLSLVVDKGDRLGIIGEEGNGKSSLLKYMVGLELDYLSSTGSVERHGRIGYLAQHIEEKWLDQTPIEYILKEDRDKEIEIQDYNKMQDVEQVCSQMKLSIPFLYYDQTISTLSGGEKVKLQLIKLLIGHYDMLCLDEPTNDLDLDTLEWLESFMLNVDLPIIFISHDVTLIENVANRILHMELVNKKSKAKWTLFNGKYETYMGERTEKRAKDEMVASNEKKAYKKQMDRVNDLENKVTHALRTATRQDPHKAAKLKSKMGTVKSSKERMQKESYLKLDTLEDEIAFEMKTTSLPDRKVLIEREHEILKIEDLVLVEDYSLHIYGGDHIAIVGENGSGKSILMQSIVSELETMPELKIGYMPQNYLSLMDATLTPVEYLVESCDVEEYKVRQHLGSLNFTSEEMTHCISDLSDGQKAKLYFVMFSLKECNVLLLDEPSRNLSMMSAPVLYDQIENSEACFICISHDRKLLERFNTVYELKDKKIIRHNS